MSVAEPGDAAWRRGLDRLDPHRPLKDVPPRRWLTFVGDCRRFLDRGGGIRALDLGWSGLDLFGCDASAPFARIDRLGMLWLRNGRPLIEFEASGAVFGCGGGIRLTYVHRPITGQVLPWDIV